MTGIFKPKYSKSEVSQRFNLKELLGYEPSDRQKELFFELAADKMVERTTSGKDIDGKKFTKYTKGYAAFKGVSQSSVDLTLSGDMLSSFEESQSQKNVVKIKIAEGTETLKAYNHNVGDTLPTRTFFGFKEEKDISRVLRDVDRIKESEVSTPSLTDLAALRQAINEEINLGFQGLDGDN